MIKILIKELFNPKLKCKRLGHKKKHRFYDGYEQPKEPRWHVVDNVQGKIYYCPRCHHMHTRTVTSRKGYSRWTCPSHMSDAVRKNGFYELK